MALDDPQAVHSTLPTVEIDGQSFPLLNRNIAAVRMEERLGGLASLEMSVTDWVTRPDGSAAHGSDSGSPLALGGGLRVFMGPAAVGASEIFDGQITALECETRESQPPLITVLAEDRLFSARRKRRSRLFDDKTLAGVIEEVAYDHGLTTEVREGLPRFTATWVQDDETDLAFLRRLLTRFDGDMQVVGDRLQVGKIGLNQRSAVTLSAGSSLESVRMTADVADQVTAMKLATFDPATGEPIQGEADAQGNGPGAGQTGADVLNEKFGPVAWPLGRHGPMPQAEADAMAQAEFDRRARAFVKATGTAIGNAQLRVGSWVSLQGVNAQFANEYAVTRCTHRFEPELGYRTDFIAECAYLGSAA